MALLKAIALSLVSTTAVAAIPPALGTATGSCYWQKGYSGAWATTDPSDKDNSHVQCFATNTTAKCPSGYFYPAGQKSKYSGCCHCMTGCASINTTACTYGDTFGDYTSVSTVNNHAAVVMDITAFEEKIKNKDYAGAKKIYTDGLFSVKSATSVRTMLGFATKNMDGTGSNVDVKPWQHSKTAFAGADHKYQDTFMQSILGGTGMFAKADDAQKDQAADKTVQCIFVNYIFYEFEKAIAGGKKPTCSTQAECDASGGAHNWDEARAFFYGPSGKNGDDSPWEIAGKRDNDYGTTGKATIDAEFTTGLKAVRKVGGPDKTATRASYDKIQKALMVAFVQAGLKYAYLSEKATGKDDLMEGYAYFRCGAGLLYGSGAKGKAATIAVLKLYEDAIKAESTNVDFCSVKMHLMDAGLTAAEIGDCSGVAAADHAKKCKIASQADYKTYLAMTECPKAPAGSPFLPKSGDTKSGDTKSGAASLTAAAGLALAMARAL